MDADEGCSRMNLPENLGMSPCDFLPLADISYINSSSNDVVHAQPEAFQRFFDIFQALYRLFIRIPGGENFAGVVGAGAARYINRPPTLTARLYPTRDSQGAPEKVLFLFTFMASTP